jgi:hypothetical protein
VAKVGFFGFDDSTGKFTFIPDATNTSEVFSGTKGTIDADLTGNVTGNLTGNVTGNVSGTTLAVSASNGTTGGISLYNGAGNETTYGIMFRNTSNQGTHGGVTADWATYFTMDATANRGWIFKNATTGGVASINTSGNAVFNGTGSFGGNVTLNNHSLTDVTEIWGKYGLIARSTDEWLRINEDNSHSNGIYFGTGIVRTDGTLQVGSSGATLNVPSGGTFNYNSGKFTIDTSGNTAIAGNTTVAGDIALSGAGKAVKFNSKFAIVYNSTTNSLDFNFIG